MLRGQANVAMAEFLVTRFTTSAANRAFTCGFNQSVGHINGWTTKGKVTRLGGLSVGGAR